MRCTVVTAGLLLLLVATGYGQTAQYPAPGRLIQIDGRGLHIHCMGTGSPTVVLEAGGGAFVHLFQPERVIDGISRAVLAVRTGSPLATR